MIFSQDRDTLRRMYTDAWAKFRQQSVLTPLEAQIAQVVDEHPEYHDIVESPETSGATGEHNPFLHMGMHLAIREQVSTDRPAGIRALCDRLSARLGDRLAAEHQMMEALGETLWEAQRSNSAPDETAYLERLERIAGK